MLNKINTTLHGDGAMVIAEATDASGQLIATCVVQTVLLVSGYVVNPNVTPSQAQTAGDVLDREIATKASIEGISKVMICVPQDQLALQDEEYTKMCVYERKVNTVALSCYVPSQATQYLN